MKKDIIQHMVDAFGLEEADVMDLFNDYLGAFEKNMQTLDEALGAKNLMEIKRAAHTIKGCALNCGDNETGAVALSLEESAKEENYADCSEKAKLLKARFEALK